MDLENNNIDQYYSLIDKNIINNLCKNESLKNLIKLSTQTDIYIFNRKNKKWQLKSKTKLLEECVQIKKKEIKTSSSLLSNLAKLNNIVNLDNVKNIYKNLENKIGNIDKFMDYVINIDINSVSDKTIIENNKIKCSSLHNIESTKPIHEFITIKNKSLKKNIILSAENFLEKLHSPTELLNETELSLNKFKNNSNTYFIEYYSNC